LLFGQIISGMLITALACWLFLISGTALYAYVDPGTFGSIGQIIFVIVNLAMLVVATCFRPIKSLLVRIKRLIGK
jgi:hypothetical protein